MTTKARSRPRTRRPAAISASVVLHAALLVAASCLPAGAIADARSAPAPDFPARLTWAPRVDVPEAVVVRAPAAEAPRVPAPPADCVRSVAVEIEDVPVAAERSSDDTVACEPRAAHSSPTFEQARRFQDFASLCPGRGGPDAGPGKGQGAGGSVGVGGSGGVGGPGGGSGSGDGGDGTAEFGEGRGAGSDGTGSGSLGRVAGGGATCGPSVVGDLPAPGYPGKARARGWEGRVVLLLSIDAHGRVTSAEVAESSGRAALDDAARDAAPDWTFAPALRDGVPVAGTLRVPVRFALTD
jgi:TonB family protein